MNTTTKRFHRSLISAFPQDHAASVTRYSGAQSRVEWWAGVVLAVSLGIVIAVLLVEAL